MTEAKSIGDMSADMIDLAREGGLDPHEAMASMAMGLVQLALALKVDKERLVYGIDVSYDVLSGKYGNEEDETWH